MSADEADAPRMDDAELALFADAVGRAASTTTGDELDRALDDLGWADALAVDERAAVATLFEAQGAHAATSGALGRVVLGALGVPEVLEAEHAAVLLPRLGTAEAPASRSAASGHSPSCVAVAAVGQDLQRHRSAVVVAVRDGRTFAALAPVGGLDARPITGLDPAAGLAEVRIDCVTVEGEWVPTPGDWTDAVAAARRAVAHEQVGAMRTMLRLAREHALERIQFGQPIAGFQAVRHRLAESLVAVEAAEAALDGAWLDGTHLTATVAKAVAGTSARAVRRHTQQVLAGIGFTTEHDLHRFVRRSIVDDALFGDAAGLTDEIGAALIRAGELPALLPL